MMQGRAPAGYLVQRSQRVLFDQPPYRVVAQEVWHTRHQTGILAQLSTVKPVQAVPLVPANLFIRIPELGSLRALAADDFELDANRLSTRLPRVRELTHAPRPTPAMRELLPAGAPRLLLLTAVALVAVLATALLLMPVGAPRAAAGDEAAAAAPPPATNFGSATPSDKYVQAFQQQVSQQLQSALVQANETQEGRLRNFEQQQHQLEDQLRAVEQSVASGAIAGATRGGGGIDAELEAPRVNTRHPIAPETGANPGAGALAAVLPGALGALAGEPLHATPGAFGPAAPGSAPYDERAYGASSSTTPARRPGRRSQYRAARLCRGAPAQRRGRRAGRTRSRQHRRAKRQLQSANGFVARLDGCMALVQGKPEIATGRIDFKLSRLTCNFTDGASRTWDAAGWLVDADGIRGVRAVIVDNSARKTAVAAAGGAVGGLGQRLSQQQYQVSAGPGGFGSSSTFAGSPVRDALGGASTGAANALGQSIADYYNLYAPSLQVGGGTPVTVVLANDLRLPPSGREISQTHTATP